MNDLKDKILDFVKKHKKGLKITALAILVGGMAFKGLMQIPQIVEGKETIANLNEQIEYEKERQNEVEKLKTMVDTDEYIEKIASEKLGLVANNAKIFVDVSSEQQ